VPKKPFPPLRFLDDKKRYYVWNAATKRKIDLGMDLAVAQERYDRLKAEYEGRPDSASGNLPEAGSLSINELLLRYLRHRRAEGADVRTIGRLKAAIRFTRPVGLDPAASFKALALRRVRDRMLAARSRRHPTRPAEAQPLSRTYVNYLVAALKSA
jgi:hypothetical protein